MSKSNKRSPKQAESYRRRKPLDLFGKSSGGGTDATAAQRSTAQRLEHLVKLGIEAYQSRRFDDAAAYLNNALSISPSLAMAHNCLGLVRRAQGDAAQAIECYQRALRHQPAYAEASNNLGVAYESRGDNGLAAAAYEEALKIKPHFAAALNNLGNVLTKLGKAEEAMKRLRQALCEQPGFAAAHNNLGLALCRLNRAEEAEQSFRRALEYQASFPEAYVNLGNALRARRQLAAAGECYRAALKSRPRYTAAWTGLGNTLLDQRRFQESLESYDQALQIDAQLAEAHFGRGNVYLELENGNGNGNGNGKWLEAESCFRRALDLNPNYGEAWNNLGSMYRAINRMEDAEQAFLRAVNVNADLVAAHNNLGNLYRQQDRQELAAKAYREVIQRQPNMPLAKLRVSTLCPAVFESRNAMECYLQDCRTEWSSIRDSFHYQDLSDLLTAANEVPYNLQFYGDNIRTVKEDYAAIFRYIGPSFHGWQPVDKIRIGCVVTAGHEVAFLRLIWDALRQMNRDEFGLTILCAEESTARFRQALGADSAPIVAIPEQPHRIVHAIREQRFDVLYYFEVGTDARNYFLPFFRLAPVQVTSWGIQVTSGIPQLDYYLSSELVEPAEADEHYSERLVRARTLLTYQRKVEAPERGKSRAAFGFSHDDHLYLCAQHLGKFHVDFDAVLAEILRRDPRGRIVGTEDKFGYGAKRLRERWGRDLADVASRIVLLPRLAQADYLSLLAAGDVMIDPLHFGGVSTTYDGLSLGKPIVTLPSRFHRGRYTAGCLTRLGLNECIARDLEDYVQIAVSLGGDRERRDHVSSQIREQSGRVFEDAEAVTEHERIFRELVAKGTGP